MVLMMTRMVIDDDGNCDIFEKEEVLMVSFQDFFIQNCPMTTLTPSVCSFPLYDTMNITRSILGMRARIVVIAKMVLMMTRMVIDESDDGNYDNGEKEEVLFIIIYISKNFFPS